MNKSQTSKSCRLLMTTAFVPALIGAVLLCFASSSQATVLTFSTDYCGSGGAPGACSPSSNGFSLVDEYGDNVAGLSQLGVASDDFGGTDWYNFYYDEQGEGFTPNVQMDYVGPSTPEFQIWDTYNSLSTVIYPSSGSAGPGQWELYFLADAGYEVQIDSLDLTKLSAGADVTASVHQGSGDGGPVLWTSGSTSVGAATTTLSPGASSSANEITLVLAFAANTDALWNWGIDNVTFSQSLVPEPATGLLCLVSLGIALTTRRRQSCML